MKITNITIRGYRNIKNVMIEMQNLLSFVSINNYGKSNLLRGIDFGFDFITRSEKVRKRMMSYYDGIPLNPFNKNSHFH